MQANLRSVRSQAAQQGWRELCLRVSSQTELTDELASLTELLKLPLSCCLAVHQVLREGNWANAEHPKTYIKQAAMAQARKMHLSIPHKDDTLECGERELVFMDGAELNDRWDGCNLTPVSEDADGPRPMPIMPLKGKHYVKAQFAPDDEVLAREEQAAESGPFWPDDCQTMLQVPDWLMTEKKAHYGENSDEFLAWKVSLTRRDWKKLGEKAGLDEWQIKVLEYRSQGISRDEAMELQPDEVSRKAIQAAWRRFARTGLKQVQNSLDKIAPWDVPEEESQDTKHIEACALPHPKATLPGNPLQRAWKHSGGTSREDLGRFLIRYRGRAPHLWGSLAKILDSECPE